MGSAAADSQIVSGVYQLEGGEWRWMSGRAVLLLKQPAEPRRLEVELYIPDAALARAVRVSVDGKVVAAGEYNGPGSYTLTSEEPVSASRVEITVDKTFSSPGDHRELGVILAGAGFR
ncbi:MAG: hypothetical protein GY953_37410 [bacterium]|nr:hypothetical protein [bacterium]